MGATTQLGFITTAWILMRLQFIRFARQLTGGFRFKKKESSKREATPAKTKENWLIASFVAVSMLMAFTNVSYRAITNIEQQLGFTPVTVSSNEKPLPKAKQPGENKQTTKTILVARPPAAGFAFPAGVIQALTLVMAISFIAITLLAIGNGDLAKPDWDLEWLSTLPVPTVTLLYARILARTLVNQMGLFLLGPLLAMIAWHAGYRAAAPLLGALALLPLLIMAATAQTFFDTGLRLRLGPAQLRNLQAILSIGAVLALLFAMSAGAPGKASYVLNWAASLPPWMSWLPSGLAVRAVTASTPAKAAEALGLLAAESLMAAMLAVTALRYMLRFGIVTAGERESARQTSARKTSPQGARRDRWTPLTPIQARELLLLGRDRTFLVQTLVMPVVLVGAQIVFNANGEDLLSSAHSHPEYWASIAFGISAYALMFSAFQTLNSEGQALWILYSVPQSLESILWEKAMLWGTASLIYPAAAFGFVFATQTPSLQLAELAVLVFLGVPIFAAIAASLGVFACDPLAQTVQRQVRPSYTYLYLLLSSVYVYSLYANTVWRRLSLLVLTALMAAALWQKARDRLPYLLDPAASPPARVSISDGLIAALLFAVLQGVVSIFEVMAKHTLTGFDILVAFTIAGALTYGGMRFAFWRLKSEGVPRTFGKGALSAVAIGAAGGTAAALAAFVYLMAAAHTSLMQDVQNTILLGDHGVLLMAGLAIIAAPIFEEFIFRGLIYGGLRRSMGLAPSVAASAAIFAIVHPPASVIPVFGLGVATALVYARSKLLIGPMAVHATYNAFIVLFQYMQASAV